MATCHYDVVPWLAPDWVLDMATGRLARGSLQRPRITLQVCRCRQEVWRIFARHHYLSGGLAAGATCYLATWDSRPVAFCAVVALLGRKGHKRISRIVTLPDFQGLGVGMRLAERVAEHQKLARLSSEHHRQSSRGDWLLRPLAEVAHDCREQARPTRANAREPRDQDFRRAGRRLVRVRRRKRCCAGVGMSGSRTDTLLDRKLLAKVVASNPLQTYCPHAPSPKQRCFLDLQCKEALYGGAAGGGKSEALLMAALQYVHVPGYAALILRRDTGRLNLAGAIIPRSHQWLAGTAATWLGAIAAGRFPRPALRRRSASATCAIPATSTATAAASTNTSPSTS